MTALNAAIIFNNSTGSDTTASGSSAGANVYGSGASTTSASAVVTGITTTGVQAGDLLWVQSSSGRQFSVIASVDSSTQVTCDDTFANTESSRTWAIGGKRAGSDLSNDSIFTDAPDGAVIEIEYTGTDYANTGSLSPALGSATEPVTIKGTGVSNPIILGTTGNSNCVRLQSGSYLFENLQFVQNKQSAGALDCIFIVSAGPRIRFSNCTFKSEQLSAGASLFRDYQNGTHIGIFSDCVFDGNNLSAFGLYRSGGTTFYAPQNFINCTFKNLINAGIRLNESRSCVVRGCVFRDCVNGVIFDSNSYHQNFIDDNIFYNLSGNGITFNNVGNLSASSYAHNIFSVITGHAFTANQDYSNAQKLSRFDRNAFHNVTGSTHNNLSSGANDITLTADPFVDAANGEFNLNADAGGGATLRSNNFSINTDTAVYPFRQYVSDDFGGGGGAVLHPLRSN